MLTPETLTRHELVGLPVRVADAANPDLVGISGRIVSETMRTLVISDGSGDRQVQKRGTTFEFRLNSSEETTYPAGGKAPAEITDPSGGKAPEEITYSVGGEAPTETTYEAASARKATGDALKREQETAGVRPGQSCSTGTGSHSSAQATEGDCEGAVYVTVDGTKLLSRPALRTETAGDTLWQSD